MARQHPCMCAALATRPGHLTCSSMIRGINVSESVTWVEHSKKISRNSIIYIYGGGLSRLGDQTAGGQGDGWRNWRTILAESSSCILAASELPQNPSRP
ncbi:uncharacterized protein LOC112056751 isoform X3 [Bicyclus anynana]|uniref:Uncharacterized protein LOC112056751 isoform X3 n=1 Tax=Bicyclus anynana TaxID=110368 RepID=A0ABM3M5C0_BICAN|nr:uncharacterized protein LOC112056751 isoform X3 [Bicyclus anynana]